MANNYKVISAIGSIRLLRANSSFRLIRVGEELQEGDVVELLSPISSMSVKLDSEVKSFSGVCKVTIKNKEIINVTASTSKPKVEQKIVENEKTYEFVEQIPFDMLSYLKTKLDAFDIEHIVDHKVLLFDIPQYLQFFIENEKLTPDEGCLIINVDDKLEIKKFDDTASFIISAYILHNTKVSKYTSYPKSYTFIKTDEDGLSVIKKEQSVEFVVEI